MTVEVGDSVDEIETGVVGQSGSNKTYPVATGTKTVTIEIPSTIEDGYVVVSTKGKKPNRGIIIRVISPR